jgi:hypothetical protein
MSTYHLKMKDLKGKKPAGYFDLSRFSEVLGDDLPMIQLSKIGRFRLMQLLRRKFGANFRNVGQAQLILKAFDAKVRVGR